MYQPADVVLFDGIIHNSPGSGYVSQSGIFTAPTAGVYMFVLSLFKTIVGTYENFWVHLMKTGNQKLARVFNGNGATYITNSVTVIVHLDIDDTVWVAADNSGSLYGISGYACSVFTGMLVNVG